MIRKRSFSFNVYNQLAIALVLISAVGVTGVFWILSEFSHQKEALEGFKEGYVDIRKLESKTLINQVVEDINYQAAGVEESLKEDLLSHVNLAWTIADNQYNRLNGVIAEEDLKQLIISTIMPLRFFEGRGYFWIHDTGYRLVAHPFRSNSIGQYDAELVDTKGQKIIQSFVDVAVDKPAGGYVTYYWNKPGVDEKYHREQGQKKIAYLRLFEPFNWVIGIGEYVEDVDRQTQKAILERISMVRNGTKGYVFVHNSAGKCLSHIAPEKIGKNRWELVDAAGVKVVQELDRIGRQSGGGFLEYVGSINPESGQPEKKISYVKSIDKWNWIIGSGVYINDIEESISAFSQKSYAGLKKRIVSTLVLLFFIVVVVYFAGRKLFQGLLVELNLFVSQSVDGERVIEPEQFRISEFRAIAIRANSLLGEKEQVEANLNRAKRMESIGLLAGGVAHDLNNILSGVVGYPELLLKKLPEDSELRKPIQAIHESGKRATTVVADLLTVARSAASIRGPHCLNTLADEYLRSPEFEKLQSIYPKVTYTKCFDAPEHTILCSPVHVKKCLMNLVVNATEAIFDGGEIVIKTKLPDIDSLDIRFRELGGKPCAVLEVCDSGTGISAEDLEHIFEPFYTKKEMGRSGTGLGLTIVWNTVEDHGGKILVDSNEHGTRFQLYFPLGKEKRRVQRSKGAIEAFRGNNERILVVDDEPYLRDIAYRMLGELGYRVESVSSGEEAVRLVCEKDFDLVVLDMLMAPGMNGQQAYEEIISHRPGMKAVIASGFSENGAVQATLGVGANGFIQKPYSSEQLGEAVQKALQS